MSKAEALLDLLSAKKFVITVSGVNDSDAALEKVFKNPKNYEGFNLLKQKEEVIPFYDKQNRTPEEKMDLIDIIIHKDPKINDGNSEAAGVMEISPGTWVFFGVGIVSRRIQT